MIFFNPYGITLWQEKKDYSKITINESPADRVEVIKLLFGQRMPLHFHSQTDEAATFFMGTGDIIIGKAEYTFTPGAIALLRRGVVHSMKIQAANTPFNILWSAGGMEFIHLFGWIIIGRNISTEFIP